MSMATNLEKHNKPSADQGRVPSMIPRLMQRRLLVQDEERELARRAHLGDDAARRKLVESNMRLVYTVAKNYTSPTIPLEDLVQEGAIGLMNAIERFDPEKGFRFSTYATHWVRQAIGKSVINRSRVIRIPAHVADGRRRFQKFRDSFEAEHGRLPTVEEEAANLGFTASKLSSVRSSDFECCSLDSGKEDQWDFDAVIADQGCEDPQATAMRQVDRARFRKLLVALPERERIVLALRLGLFGQEPQMLHAEIALKLNVSREAVRKIEMRAIRSLRRALASESEPLDTHSL